MLAGGLHPSMLCARDRVQLGQISTKTQKEHSNSSRRHFLSSKEYLFYQGRLMTRHAAKRIHACEMVGDLSVILATDQNRSSAWLKDT